MSRRHISYLLLHWTRKKRNYNIFVLACYSLILNSQIILSQFKTSDDCKQVQKHETYCNVVFLKENIIILYFELIWHPSEPSEVPQLIELFYWKDSTYSDWTLVHSILHALSDKSLLLNFLTCNKTCPVWNAESLCMIVKYLGFPVIWQLWQKVL